MPVLPKSICDDVLMDFDALVEVRVSVCVGVYLEGVGVCPRCGVGESSVGWIDKYVCVWVRVSVNTCVCA